MGTVWTLGRWVCRPGREDAFVAAWTELSEWTRDRYPDARGTLLRDREDPTVFFSFGPWRDLGEIEAWRADPGFRERVERIRELLEGFEPHTLDPVVAPEG